MQILDTIQVLDNSYKSCNALASGHASGVAILVASTYVQLVRAIYRICDRVTPADVCLYARLSRIVAVCLSYFDYSLAEIDEDYQQICALVR